MTTIGPDYKNRNRRKSAGQGSERDRDSRPSVGDEEMLYAKRR